MRIAQILATVEIVTGVLVGVLLLAVALMSEEPIPVWLAAGVAAVYWLGFWELVRHALELAGKGRG